ncbi:YgjP-like metallopeptidase domain-containing protein [Alteromonas macleodii]|uniref:YgjP-like metallopeptidase domain-containing protein n=1 Tax=Alteromonas macleodii TaxID=28108 RepID=UPI001E4888E5|nr:YgjP-like metallopeptidase domain-containing protein [Alteromonas macleodii]
MCIYHYSIYRRNESPSTIELINCHIAEHNHSERFLRLLIQIVPNWKEEKAN